MPFNLTDIAIERQEELERAVSESKKAQSDAKALQVLLGALSDVREAVSEAAVSEVTVNNLDEVKASLRNELNRLSKPILKAISGLALDKKRLQEIQDRVTAENAVAMEQTHDVQVVKKPKQRIEISNLNDLAFPNDVNVSNLSDLQAYFDNLASVMRETFRIDIPTPQVTVQAPDVNIPEIQVPEIQIPESIVNVDAPDMKPLLDAIKSLKDTIRRTSAKQDRQMTAVSQGLNESSARKAFKQALSTADMRNGTAGGKSLTDDSAGVALASDTKCSIVDVTCAGGIMSVGDSTSVAAASGSEVGVILTPGSTFYRIHCSNLNQVFVSGATGTRACYVYYV